MAATILSDKHLKESYSGDVSLVSSATSSPPLTPSFAINDKFDYSVPALVSLLKRPVEEGTTPRQLLKELDLDLDLDLKVSELLKEGTSRAHVEAENSLGAAALIKGELELQEYIRWLAILWRVYDALELGLNEHASDPVLAPTYDPSVLARADSLAKDIRFLLDRLPKDALSSPPQQTSMPEGPLPPFPLPSFLLEVFTNPPAALTTYLDHLKTLSSSSQTAPGLLAHSYVRYLGDLSGGQFISAKIKRAYDLEGLDGLRFYHFDLQNRASSGEEESRADGRRKAGEVKDWFRKGMDEGVGEDEALKATLIREANLAFALNTYLFSVIQLAPPKPKELSRLEQIAIMTHPDGTPLRYYEKRQLVQEEQERLRKLHPEMYASEPNTWKQRIERFVLFGGTVLVGWAFSQYVAPQLSQFVAEKVGSLKGEL